MNTTFDVKKIRADIKAKKIKVKDLALEVGLTPNTLSSALNGNRALGVPAQKLILKMVSEKTLKPKAS